MANPSASPMPMDPNAPAPDAQASGAPPKAGGSKSPAALLADAYQALMAVMDLISGSDAIDPEEKQELQQIIQEYQEFAQGLAGGDKEGAQKPKGKEAVAMPQPSNYGPGAEPAM